MKYRKKPVIIDAFRFRINDIPDWFMDKVSTNEITMHETQKPGYKSCCLINTLEGVMRGEEGDYIIKGIKGEIYSCKANIFEESYEKAE